MDDGVDEDEARTERMDGWIIWEAEERAEKEAEERAEREGMG